MNSLLIATVVVETLDVAKNDLSIIAEITDEKIISGIMEII